MWRERLAHQKLMCSISYKFGLRYKLDIGFNTICNLIKPFLSQKSFRSVEKLIRFIFPRIIQYPESFEKEQIVSKNKIINYVPECWSHRGASPNHPDNTLLSMAETIRLGADGIETDIHVTSDDELVLFHDPDLQNSTDGTGLIRTQPWYGVIEHARLLKDPTLAIPRFQDVCQLLLKSENRHVKLHLDIKLTNDPFRLFTILKQNLNKLSQQYSQTDIQSLLDRIQLGIWHTKFIQPAKTILPSFNLIHIGVSPLIAKKYFWDDCQGFSMRASAMRTQEGKQFLKECQTKGKFVSIWTVNDEPEMVQVIGWGVDAILTDKVSNLKKVQSMSSTKGLWRFPYFSLPELLILEVFNQCATLGYIEFAAKMTMQEGVALKQHAE